MDNSTSTMNSSQELQKSVSASNNELEHLAKKPTYTLDLEEIEDNVPTWLKEHGKFVLWRYVYEDGRWKKPPFSTSGRKIQDKSLSRCAVTFSDALNAYESGTFDGIGLVIDDGIAAVDIDHCVNEDGEFSELATYVQSKFPGCYVETSPSGEGIHIYMLTSLSNGDQWFENHEVIDRDGQLHGKLEVYVPPTRRFLTLTGRSGYGDMHDMTSQLVALLDRLMLKPEVNHEQSEDVKRKAMRGISDADLLRKMRNAKDGEKFRSLFDQGDISAYGNDHSSADMALMRILAFWTVKDAERMERLFSRSALARDKWYQRADYRESTIKYAIDNTDVTYTPKTSRRSDATVMMDFGGKSRLTIESLEDELYDMGITVKMDSITLKANIDGVSMVQKEDAAECLPAILHSALANRYTGASIGIIGEYLAVIAAKNKKNPVLEYLEGITWDGIDRFEALYEALGVTDDLSKTLIYKWFWQGHALLRNNYEDRYNADGVLTLVGPQGVGKTSTFRHFAIRPKWIHEGGKLEKFDKDYERRMITNWIAEIGEADSVLKKADAGRLKSFITQGFDEYRLPFGHTDREVPRHTNLCATVNPKVFLCDPTGSRRFWTVQVDDIDLDALHAIPAEQLWAQVWEESARHNLQGFRLTKDEMRRVNERNTEHETSIRAEDECRDILAEFESVEFVPMTMTQFQSQHDVLKKYRVNDISAALNRIGVKRYEHSRYKGKSGRYYMLPCKQQ